MKFSKIVVVLCLIGAFAFGFSGCSAKQAEFLKDPNALKQVRSEIIIGKTTQDEILSKYGKPQKKVRVKFMPRREISQLKYMTFKYADLYYEYKEEKEKDARRFIPGVGGLFGHKMNVNNMWITIDENSIVRNVLTGSTNINSKVLNRNYEKDTNEVLKAGYITGNDKISTLNVENEAKNIIKNKAKLDKKSLITKYGEPNIIGKAKTDLIKKDFGVEGASEGYIWMSARFEAENDFKTFVPYAGSALANKIGGFRAIVVFFDENGKVLYADRNKSVKEVKKFKQEQEQEDE